MKTALVLALVLAPAVAFAGVEGKRIVHRGSGELPEEADELSYRIDWTWQDQPVQTTEKTERGSELMLNDEMRADLLQMRVGERRHLWGRDVDGMMCDHFGCGPAQNWTATVELVAVTPHHDELPDGLRIAAHPLRVVDGTTSAVLPGDEAWTLREVRRDGDQVRIEVTYEPATRHATLVFELAVLRARLADARAVAALARGNRGEAAEQLEGAIALDPQFDDAYLHRALLHVGTAASAHDADAHDAADADLAVVAERSPVWLAWRLRSDKTLAPLRALPPARALEAAGGAVDAIDFDESGLNVLAEPSGRFLAVEAYPTYVGEAMRIIDRESGRIVASIPVRCTDPNGWSGSAGAPERCRAKSVGARALAAFGFKRTASVTTAGDAGVQQTLSAAKYAREPLEVQIERVGDLEIRRWKSSYPRWSQIEVVDLRPHVALTPAHVEAAPAPLAAATAPVEPPPAPAHVAPAPPPARDHHGWLAPLLLLGLAAALARPPHALTRRA